MKSQTVIDPATILRTLIQFNTTNPPGDEEEAVSWIRELLASIGIPSKIIAREASCRRYRDSLKYAVNNSLSGCQCFVDY